MRFADLAGSLACMAGVVILGCGRQERGARQTTATTPAGIPTPVLVALAASPSPSPSEIYRVGGDVTEPVEIFRVKPHIPESMRRNRMGGVLIFQAIIGADGKVSSMQSYRPVPTQARECMDLITSQLSQWRYKPALYKGTPVPVYLTITVLHQPC